MLTCKKCGKEYFPIDPSQRYCSKECRDKAGSDVAKQRQLAKINFAIEWAAWKRDFAEGKTQSNLEVPK